MRATLRLWICAAVVCVACGGDDDDAPPASSTLPATPPTVPTPPIPQVPAPPQPGPSWTDLVLPSSVPGWALQPAQDHGQSQGYILDYQHDGAGVRASVFVYNRDIPGIRRDPEMLRAELREATSGVHRAREAGAYEAVRELPPSDTRLGSAPNAPFAVMQPLFVTNGGVERQSAIYISTHRAFFVKIRTTVQRGPSPAADQAIAALLAQIGAGLREDGSAVGTVVTAFGQPVALPNAPGCDVASCCNAARATEPSVDLFCQLGAANNDPCAQQLERVRNYLRERGAAIPPACQ